MNSNNLSDTKRLEQLLYLNLAQTRRAASYLARQEINNLLADLGDKPMRLEHFGFKVYSQNDEDGILEELFFRLGIERGRFLEIGVENGLECNSLYLLHKGWTGIWIDGNVRQRPVIEAKFGGLLENGRLALHIDFVTKENIQSLLAELKVSEDLDFLSIDIDGMDIYLMESLPVKPKVICVEYNSKFPPTLSKRPVYNPGLGWRGTDYMGSSLLALSETAQDLGYTLIATNLVGINAFFVRNDLLGDKFPDAGDVGLLYNPPRYWLCQDHFCSIGHAADFGPYTDLTLPDTDRR